MLVSHAQKELELVGDLGYDGMVAKSALDIIELFAKQGHSGNSAMMTTGLVNRLMRFEPLTPLTGEENEWNEVGEGMKQNNRCSHVFSHEGRAYDINVEGRPTIFFPYTPGN